MTGLLGMTDLVITNGVLGGGTAAGLTSLYSRNTIVDKREKCKKLEEKATMLKVNLKKGFISLALKEL